MVTLAFDRGSNDPCDGLAELALAGGVRMPAIDGARRENLRRIEEARAAGFGYRGIGARQALSGRLASTKAEIHEWGEFAEGRGRHEQHLRHSAGRSGKRF